MGRFLTPARICLLALVRQFQMGATLSQADLPVLDFIARQIITSADHEYIGVSERNAFSGPPDISVFEENLYRLPSHHARRSVYDVLLVAIWSLSGVESLRTLVGEQSYKTTGVPVRTVTPASPIGQFVRRCHVEFARMPYDESLALWKAFAAFRAPSYTDWERKNHRVAVRSLMIWDRDSMGVPRRRDRNRLFLYELSSSMIDVDMLLGSAIQHLQKLGTRVPDDVRSRLKRWIGDRSESSTQSLHFFMEFLEHWRSGQYTMALESLHRYFDYSLAARSGGADDMKFHYQYALLHLSVLHADFECWEESVNAMNECIDTARENQDTACVNYALSWLLYLRHAHPDKGTSFGTIAGVGASGASELDEIASLKQRAKEGKHWMVLSSTLLEEAKLEMYSGGSNNRAQEHVLQAMYINVRHDLRSFTSAAILFYGASLDRIGQTHLADRYYELPNSVYAQDCPLSERVRSTCRIAYKLAQSGSYTSAMELLSSAMPVARGVLKFQQRIKAFTALIHLRRSLHRSNKQAVSYYLTQLRPLRSSSDPEIMFEINSLEAEALIKQGRLEEALKKVNEQLRCLKGGSTDLAQRLHYLILKSRVYAAGGQASKGFAVALRATSTAARHTLLPVLLEGLAALGRVLIELAEFQAAREVLEAVLPKAIEFDRAELTARLYVAIGEACVGHAGHACEAGSADQSWSMREAQAFIEHGRVAFERVEDVDGMLDCQLMKGRVAAWNKDRSNALQANRGYRQLLASKYSHGKDEQFVD